MPSTPKSAAPAKPRARATVTRADVVNFYRLANDRDPESPEAIHGFLALNIREVVRTFFGSAEFDSRVIAALAQGRSPWAFGEGPAPDLVAWAAKRLPLSQAGRVAVAGSVQTWPDLYVALLSDAEFRQATGGAAIIQPAHIAALSRLSRFQGQVERIDARSVIGWAMALEPGQGPVRVEVSIDGSPMASGLADRFRRTLQDILGGDGHVGYEIALPPDRLAGHGTAFVEVRAGPERVLIGTGELDRRRPDTSRLQSLRSDITAVRETLTRLERELPLAMSGAGADLADYGAYYEDWYRNAVFVRGAEAMGLAIWLDAWGAEPVDIHRATDGIVGQMTAGDHLVIVAGSGQGAYATDIANRAGWIGEGRISVVMTDAEDAVVRLRAAAELTPDAEAVVLTDAGMILAPAFLGLAAARLQGEPLLQALYFDEDGLDDADPADVRTRRHADPVLRSGYDRDLLLQTPYAGTTLVFRREALERVGLNEGCSGLHGCDALLRLDAMPGAVGHQPAIVATRTGPVRTPEADVWLACVRRELARTGSTAIAEPRIDALGAPARGAVRVRPAGPACTVSVIIPTRDGLHLLKPCIDSILAHRTSNTAVLELIIVDHESREPETKAYLAGLAEQGLARIMPFEGPFNWALINNLAAAEATGQVLIFLNNDTLVVSPDWMDELAAQALRLEVGIVGCRLIYGDGTIQHAGFLARGSAPDMLIHDGVGSAGSDGGYLGRHALLHRTVAVTGACMAMRAEVFRHLGGFDAAQLPIEGNDVDLCFRSLAADLAVLYDPYATLYHLESRSRRFAFTGPEREASLAAAAIIRERWGERFGEDPGFNPHFDRIALPFTRLRPPPARIFLA